VPASANTLWSIASITKPVTAATFMACVDRGLLSLDAPLSGVLPEFARDGDKRPWRRDVTPRHLLTHTSGLAGFSRDNLAMRKRHAPVDDFIASFMGEYVHFQPGRWHLYTSVGLGLIAECVGRSAGGAEGDDHPERRAARRAGLSGADPARRDVGSDAPATRARALGIGLGGQGRRAERLHGRPESHHGVRALRRERLDRLGGPRGRAGGGVADEPRVAVVVAGARAPHGTAGERDHGRARLKSCHITPADVSGTVQTTRFSRTCTGS